MAQDVDTSEEDDDDASDVDLEMLDEGIEDDSYENKLDTHRRRRVKRALDESDYSLRGESSGEGDTSERDESGNDEDARDDDFSLASEPESDGSILVDDDEDISMIDEADLDEGDQDIARYNSDVEYADDEGLPSERKTEDTSSLMQGHVDLLVAVLKQLDEVDIDALARSLKCSHDIASSKYRVFRQNCLGNNEKQADRTLLLALSSQLKKVDTLELGNRLGVTRIVARHRWYQFKLKISKPERKSAGTNEKTVTSRKAMGKLYSYTSQEQFC
jgi:hypothetical protein